MSAILLAEWPKAMIYSGTVLRFPAISPYEAWVDFMLVVLPAQDNALVVQTGYKAGLVAQVLPQEAGPTGAIGRDWLLDNWQTWVFPATPAQQVWVMPAAKSGPIRE